MTDVVSVSAGADQLNTFRQICQAATVADGVDKAAQLERDSIVDR